MNYWIIPANPKRYRLADVVRELPFVDWRQHNNFEVGDIVYIYNLRPDSQILYKMEVKKGKLTLTGKGTVRPHRNVSALNSRCIL